MFSKLIESSNSIALHSADTRKVFGLNDRYGINYLSENDGLCEFAALEDHILKQERGLSVKLERGIDVADIGCGTGQALLHLAKLYPNSQFTGYDTCAEDIALAILDASEMGLQNVQFEVAEVANLSPDIMFDLILPSTRHLTGRYRSRYGFIASSLDKVSFTDDCI